jgi:hypothetical protein
MASPNTAINFGTNRDLTLNIVLSFVAQLLDFDIGTGANADVPTDVVEGFVREGFEKIVMADTGWPYYQTSYEFDAAPTISLTALSAVGPSATATVASHGYLSGDLVTITGCTPSAYNGTFSVTVPANDTTTFSYTMLSSPGSASILGIVNPGSAVAGTDGRSYNANFTQVLPVQATFAYASFNDIAKINNCVNVTDMGNQLIYTDNYRAEQVWPINSDNDIEGIPAYWSLWGSAINLWPKPDSAYTIRIMGYRRYNINWLSDGNLAIDIDPEFHMPLMNYVLARIFQFQEDPDMAAIYMNNYEQGVAMIRGWKTAVNRNQQMVLSGGLQLNPYDYYRYMANLSLRAVAVGEWG